MKRHIIIILVVIAVILIATGIILFLFGNGYFSTQKMNKDCDNSKYENKGSQATLLYESKFVTDNNVKIYNEDIEIFTGETCIVNVTYAHIPFVELLEKAGANTKWITKNIAIITFEDSKYILNLNKGTFYKAEEKIDLIMPAPGCETFYCYSIEKDIILDENTAKVILQQMGVHCYVNIDMANLTVNFTTETENSSVSNENE